MRRYSIIQVEDTVNNKSWFEVERILIGGVGEDHKPERMCRFNGPLLHEDAKPYYFSDINRPERFADIDSAEKEVTKWFTPKIRTTVKVLEL